MSALDELAVRSRRLRITSLDHDAATHQAALLMTMDGESAEPVEIHLGMPDGTLAGVTTLLDVLDLMRAPVTMSASLPVRGVAAALFVAHPGERLLHERASLDLRLPAEPVTSGDIETAAAISRALRDDLRARLAARAGLAEDRIIELTTSGGFIDAPTCVEAGLADALS